jgi:hypothetical protein
MQLNVQSHSGVGCEQAQSEHFVFRCNGDTAISTTSRGTITHISCKCRACFSFALERRTDVTAVSPRLPSYFLFSYSAIGRVCPCVFLFVSPRNPSSYQRKLSLLFFVYSCHIIHYRPRRFHTSQAFHRQLQRPCKEDSSSSLSLAL